MRERLTSSLHPVVIERITRDALSDECAATYDYTMSSNCAHVLLLLRSGTITPDLGKPLLGLYKSMLRTGPSCLELDPGLEDLHFNLERYVIDQLGAEVGGAMHTGRSRNDLKSTTTRMLARDLSIALVAEALELRTTIVDLAAQHERTVMPGYTHLRAAQPITFGHYLLAIAGALQRDVGRLMAAYRSTDLCPLGSGALAGTSYPLDRELAATLLGFQGLVENSLDGVATRDYVLELLASMSSLCVTLSRLAQDLYVWSTEEFGFVTFDDSVCIVSSIMPQKKNPITLEHVKAKASQVAGCYAAAAGAMTSAPYSNVREVNLEGVRPLRRGVTETSASVALMTVTVGGLQVHAERMEALAQSDFSTATELADWLVREVGLPFRAAHRTVAGLVGRALAQGKAATALDDDDVRALIDDVRLLAPNGAVDTASWGVPALLRVCDARESVTAKRTLGSPHPRETARMGREATAAIQADQAWLRSRRAELQAAGDELTRRVDEALG